MEQEKKDGNYSLNTLKEIWKYDPLRLLDLGNLAQVLVSQDKVEIDEEARAITNFEKLTENRPRPVSHTFVDAIRLLPDVISLLAGPGTAVAKKMVPGKQAAKKAPTIAGKLVAEKTSEAAQALDKSKFLSGIDKTIAAKNWVNNLYENEAAMHRVAGKKLTPEEIELVKKELPNKIKDSLRVQNFGISRLERIDKTLGGLPEVTLEKLDTLGEYFIHNKILAPVEWENLAKSLAELPKYQRRPNFSRIDVNTVLKGIPKDKHKVVLDVLLSTGKGLTTPLPVFTGTVKGIESSINELAKSKLQTNEGLVMKPDYWTLGSEPTPVSDFFASMFNVDFDDPARFNKKDIDVFFEFLEDIGTIEPGIKDKWTPRQKVSVLREMMSDKEYGSYIKKRWANSDYKKDLIKYYSGE